MWCCVEIINRRIMLYTSKDREKNMFSDDLTFITLSNSRPRPSGLGEIDGLHGTSMQSCILTYDLCTGEPLRRPKPAQDEWYVIMSGLPFIKALAAYWVGTSVQGLRCHFISMPGKSPMKLEVTSRHDHSCLLGRKASKQTNKQTNKQIYQTVLICYKESLRT